MIIPRFSIGWYTFWLVFFFPIAIVLWLSYKGRLNAYEDWASERGVYDE